MQNNKTAIPQTISQKFAGSEYKGNYVYAAAMNLAWNDLCENIIHAKVQLSTDDDKALTIASKLNHSDFSKNDLNTESYYIKSGYGKKTLEIISRECREKFPQKSFENFHLEVADTDIIAYAYFIKKIEYFVPFKEGNMTFHYPIFISNQNGRFLSEQYDRVKGFKAEDRAQKDNIQILKYWNDNQFIITLKLKGDQDELFLLKGFPEAKPEEILVEINNFHDPVQNKYNFEKMANKDTFSMPYLKFSYERFYREIKGKNLGNQGFENYSLGDILENINFKMDYKGAEVENEAIILPQKARIGHHNRNFHLSENFWVIMKQKSSKNPYFILHVKNAEFMEKVKPPLE